MVIVTRPLDEPTRRLPTNTRQMELSSMRAYAERRYPFGHAEVQATTAQYFGSASDRESGWRFFTEIAWGYEPGKLIWVLLRIQCEVLRNQQFTEPPPR